MIVDVGCGKGRSLNWFLDRYRGNRIVGISSTPPSVPGREEAPARRHANVEILCGDATVLLPPDGTVFYLFNPFDESVTRRFAEAMLDRGDPATIVYLNAKHTVAFEGDPRFTVAPIAPPGLSFRSVTVRSADRRSRSRITPQASANATEEASTAAPAPVTPQRSPSTTISGSITAVSTPCAQSRRPGLPIVTGNVFVQLRTSWIAAATRISRAAGTAGR